MKHLSEYKDEEAFEVLADLIEPVINIFGDEEVAKFYRSKVMVKAVEVALKKHPSDVKLMLAVLDRTPVEEYHCNLLTLPKLLLSIFSDPELQSFFSSQEQIISETPSGLPTETTEADSNTSSNI